MALYTFAPMLQEKAVRFYTDNICAAAYLTFQGGPSKKLTQIATALWAIALEREISISTAFLAGKDNGLADHLSRPNPIYEWKLHLRIWNLLDSVFGRHTIDRFASMITPELLRYNIRYLDPFSERADALRQCNWG